MTLLVLAVTGAAEGTILANSFGTPVWVSATLMFALIVVLNLARGCHQGALVLVLLLIVVFVAYFVVIVTTTALQLCGRPVRREARLAGQRANYALYNVAAVPVGVRRRKPSGHRACIGGVLALFSR